MKLIFLDLDGVLVTRRPGIMEDKLLSNLASVVERTGARIVLSSDWRRHPSARAEAQRVLRTVGLEFIDFTPCMSAFLPQRPTEIMQWKKDYSKRQNAEHISHWLAIDDRFLTEERHGQYLRGHFVHTQPLRGLTEQAVEECVKILNSEVPQGPPSGDELLVRFGSEPLGQRTVGGPPRRSASSGRLQLPAATKAATVPANGRARGRSLSPAMAPRL
mmetsp:Transcript_72786/g.187757  ORF Transcript_72786/g.187757 Transcript_72786/m.187757 type:complete len:217 (-) Transcript_72786:109-759(-)